MSDSHVVRFAILGFGLHAAKRLLPAFAASRETELVGLWRRNLDEAKRNATDAGVAHAFQTREELCSSPDVDAVFVTSPDAMHHDDVLLALRGGKAVLCEKPMAMDARQAESMRAAAEAAGVLLGVAQNMRWNRSLEWMRDAIAAGRIGEPQLAHVQFAMPGERSPRRWIADGTLACGGPIGDIGVHCLDAIRFVLGREVLSLQTVAREGGAYQGMEAMASLQGVMDGGCLVNVAVSAMAAYRTQVEVLGSKGALVGENALTSDKPVTVQLREGGHLVEEVEINNAGSFTRMLDDFAEAVRGGAPFASDAANGVTNMLLLDAAYRGWKSGRTEQVRP